MVGVLSVVGVLHTPFPVLGHRSLLVAGLDQLPHSPAGHHLGFPGYPEDQSMLGLSLTPGNPRCLLAGMTVLFTKLWAPCASLPQPSPLYLSRQTWTQPSYSPRL